MGDRENEIRDVLTRATGTGWEAAYRGDVAYLLDRVEALEAALTTERARVVSLRHESGRLRHEPSCSVRVCGSSVKHCSCGRGEVVAEPVRRGCWTCGHNRGGNCAPYREDRAVRAWTFPIVSPDDMPPRDADGCPGWAAKS